MRNEENMINCECSLCYHKSYKSRHLNSITHIKGLEEIEKINKRSNEKGSKESEL